MIPPAPTRKTRPEPTSVASEVLPRDGERAPNWNESVILAMACELHANGQSTADTVHAALVLGRRLNCGGALLIGWDRVDLLIIEPGRASTAVTREAVPVAIGMNRVAALMAEYEKLLAGEAQLTGAEPIIAAIAMTPPLAWWIFAGASGAGATALALIFGETRFPALAEIATAAALGGVARRVLAHWGAGLLLQNVIAAFIGGLGAAQALRVGLTGDVLLAAACPSMILIPGPHLLNGVLDLFSNRVTLGVSRLVFAAMALMAISAGLVAGLASSGQVLPTAAHNAAVPLILDAAAGGVVAACYGVFYAMPARMLVWPAAIGMLAHAVHWVAQEDFGVDAVWAAALASLLAGAALTPVARRFHLPFAGVGFASVVSMLPGILVFPMSSALVAIAQRGSASSPALVAGAIGDGVNAIAIVLAMTLGLLSPKGLVDFVRLRRAAPRTESNAPGGMTHG